MKRLILSSILIIGLPACSTVKMPNLDFLDASFKDDARNIDQSVPSVAEAPEIPTDVRSSQEWDSSATDMIKIRDRFQRIDTGNTALTNEEFEKTFNDLEAQARAYKLDDPQE